MALNPVNPITQSRSLEAPSHVIASTGTPFYRLWQDTTSDLSDSRQIPDLGVDANVSGPDIDTSGLTYILSTNKSPYLDLAHLIAAFSGEPTVATSLKVKVYGFVPFAGKGDPSTNLGKASGESGLRFSDVTFGGGIWIPLYNADGDHEFDFGTDIHTTKNRTSATSTGVYIQAPPSNFFFCGGCSHVAAVPTQACVHNGDASMLLGRLIS